METVRQTSNRLGNAGSVIGAFVDMAAGAGVQIKELVEEEILW